MLPLKQYFPTNEFLHGVLQQEAMVILPENTSKPKIQHGNVLRQPLKLSSFNPLVAKTFS